MYYPVGWPKNIALDLKRRYLKDELSGDAPKEKILDISSNNERNLILILTNISLRIWFCKPSVEIVFHTRNENSIRTFGYNLSADWRPDSGTIVVQTTEDYLLFYKCGLIWWINYIVMSCYNLVIANYEIRTHPKEIKLNNQFLKFINVSAEVHLMSVLDNRLLTLLLDATIHLFNFDIAHSNSSPMTHHHNHSLNHLNHVNHGTNLARIRFINEIIVDLLNVHPQCVTSIVLSTIHNEPLVKASDPSILLNICGRLFLLESKIQLILEIIVPVVLVA